MTLLLGNAFLAVVILVSIAVTTARTAIVATIGAVVVVVVSGEVAALLGVLDEEFNEVTLRLALGFVPNSAYRGLVFETVVGVLSAGASGYASPLVNVAGLLLWTGGSLGAAVGLLRWRIE